MRRLILVFVSLSLAIPALALDFRSAAGPATVLYDAPSTAAQPLFVINRGYPLEVVVSVSGWAKVRDSSGALAWVQQTQLSTTRMVVVRAAADIFTQPQNGAQVDAHVAAGVMLPWLENLSGGWVKIRLPDQSIGYIKLDRIWGA